MISSLLQTADCLYKSGFAAIGLRCIDPISLYLKKLVMLSNSLDVVDEGLCHFDLI
jgi:hypothetical protein